MGLLWIVLLLLKGCIASLGKEDCSKECVVFNIPHILCAPKVSEVSITPYYEYASIPQFRNLLSKEYTVPLDQLISEEFKLKPCKEPQKPDKTPKPDCFDPAIFLPQTANPEVVVEPKEENTLAVNEEPTTETTPPVVSSATGVDKSKNYPVLQPPPKIPVPCVEPPKKPCIPIECQAPILQNAPTSRYVYPDCGCSYYPPIYANPRYLYELSSLYNPPCNNHPVIYPNENNFYPTNQEYFGRKPSPISRGYQNRPTTVQDNKEYSNVPAEQPQYYYNKNPKDQFLMPVATENDGPAPIYVNPSYINKFCNAYSPPSNPSPPTKPEPTYSPVQILNQNKEVKPPVEVPVKSEPNPINKEEFDIDFTKAFIENQEVNTQPQGEAPAAEEPTTSYDGQYPTDVAAEEAGGSGGNDSPSSKTEIKERW